MKILNAVLCIRVRFSRYFENSQCLPLNDQAVEEQNHVPQTPTTTPDEDITSHITDTLLEREQTHRVTLPDN